MGLVLIIMLICSMVLLGYWQRRRSKKLFLNAVKKLKEIDLRETKEGDWYRFISQNVRFLYYAEACSTRVAIAFGRERFLADA